MLLKNVFLVKSCPSTSRRGTIHPRKVGGQKQECLCLRLSDQTPNIFLTSLPPQGGSEATIQNRRHETCFAQATVTSLPPPACILHPVSVHHFAPPPALLPSPKCSCSP